MPARCLTLTGSGVALTILNSIESSTLELDDSSINVQSDQAIRGWGKGTGSSSGAASPPLARDLGMPLVDYPLSDSDAEREPESGPGSDSTPTEPPAKRQRRRSTPTATPGPGDGRSSSDAPTPSLPPLPPAFHDLYASTVRRSVFDDPSLHQGRKRQTPHVAGNWPTHLYIEWHPSRGQYDVLVRLIQRAAKKLDRRGTQLHDFLTSDLGAPLPLHISLSRPIALDTARKDDYLDEVSLAVKACNTGRFAVAPRALAWYESPDSNRTFLVLRVATAGDPPENEKDRELAALLAACNGVARRFDQPALYPSGSGDGGAVEDAFHVSIGWTFGLAADDEAAVEALGLFGDEEFRGMRAWEIEVSGVKAKIGNVVTHIPLSSRQPSRSLFGI